MKTALIALLVVVAGAVAYAVSPLSVRPTGVWAEPARQESAGGTLDVTLDARKSPVTVNGVSKDRTVYNAAYLGPTMIVRGGDVLRVKAINGIDEDTDVHFHGSHVSPKGHSDNVFVRIEPRETFDYEVRWPATHPPGLYWYHPHWHGHTDDQVSDGMAGALIVKGALDDLPGIACLSWACGCRQRSCRTRTIVRQRSTARGRSRFPWSSRQWRF